MYNGLLHLHNFLRWVILLLLVIAIIKSFTGMSRKTFTGGDRKLGTFLMISAHIQLLIGLYQWLIGRYGIFSNSIPEGVSIMGDKFYRFYMVEHPVAMILATVLITVGRGQAKKSISDEKKHKRAFGMYMIALILILAAVPWPFREIVARPWFPGMQ